MKEEYILKEEEYGSIFVRLFDAMLEQTFYIDYPRVMCLRTVSGYERKAK